MPRSSGRSRVVPVSAGAPGELPLPSAAPAAPQPASARHSPVRTSTGVGFMCVILSGTEHPRGGTAVARSRLKPPRAACGASGRVRRSRRPVSVKLTQLARSRASTHEAAGSLSRSDSQSALAVFVVVALVARLLLGPAGRRLQVVTDACSDANAAAAYLMWMLTEKTSCMAP